MWPAPKYSAPTAGVAIAEVVKVTIVEIALIVKLCPVVSKPQGSTQLTGSLRIYLLLFFPITFKQDINCLKIPVSSNGKNEYYYPLFNPWSKKRYI